MKKLMPLLLKKNPLLIDGEKCKFPVDITPINIPLNVLINRNPSNKQPQYLKVENYLSEFKSDKEKVWKSLGITNPQWGNIKGDINKQLDLLNFINTSTLYTNSEYPEIKSVKDALDKLLYKDLSVSFSCTPNVASKTDVITEITYRWTCNKENVSYLFNNEEVTGTSKTINGEFTDNVTATLSVSDGVKTVTKTCTLNFYFPIMYKHTGLDEYNRLLLPTRKCTIAADCPDGLYIVIFIPLSYGKATLTVNGFEGGFTEEIVDFGEPLGEYYTYTSVNPSLGETKIVIT